MVVVRALALLSVGLFVSTSIARAQDLETGLAQYREGRLRDALATLELAVAAPLDDRAALSTAHLHLGILRASLGDEARARTDFAMACALTPGLAAPAELRPALRRVFDESCATASALRMDARASDAGLVVALSGGVPGLVERLRVRAGDEVLAEVDAASEQTIALADRSRAVLLEALASGGTVVARAELAAPTPTPEPVAASLGAPLPEPTRTEVAEVALAPTPEPSRGPDVEPWIWVVLGIAVAGGIAGGVAGGVIASEQPSGLVLSMPEIVP